MDWRYITTAALVATSAAILINAKTAGSLSAAFQKPAALYQSGMILQWQALDQAGWSNFVITMDRCLRSFATNDQRPIEQWNYAILYWQEPQHRTDPRDFICHVDTGALDPESAVIAQAERWFEIQIARNDQWEIGGQPIEQQRDQYQWYHSYRLPFQGSLLEESIAKNSHVAMSKRMFRLASLNLTQPAEDGTVRLSFQLTAQHNFVYPSPVF